jgi:hypothetical protein
MATDRRIVYGATCVWWDSIDKAAYGLRTGLPVCPHCGSVLFEVENIEVWNELIEKADEKEPGYKELLEWMRGRCFKTLDDARIAFMEANLD